MYGSPIAFSPTLGHELVQVAVEPSHGDLDHVVQPAESRVRPEPRAVSRRAFHVPHSVTWTLAIERPIGGYLFEKAILHRFLGSSNLTSSGSKWSGS
jgi:hypothetical protein